METLRDLAKWIKENSPTNEITVRLSDDNETLWFIPTLDRDKPIKVVFED